MPVFELPCFQRKLLGLCMVAKTRSITDQFIKHHKKVDKSKNSLDPYGIFIKPSQSDYIANVNGRFCPILSSIPKELHIIYH